MTNVIQIVTTTPTKEDAERLARELVERRLAACVQVDGPIVSFYWWQGALKRAEEWRCLIKTRADLFGELEQAVRALHPYEVPEILALPVSAGNEAYLDWLSNEVGRPPRP